MTTLINEGESPMKRWSIPAIALLLGIGLGSYFVSTHLHGQPPRAKSANRGHPSRIDVLPRHRQENPAGRRQHRRQGQGRYRHAKAATARRRPGRVSPLLRGVRQAARRRRGAAARFRLRLLRRCQRRHRHQLPRRRRGRPGRRAACRWPQVHLTRTSAATAAPTWPSSSWISRAPRCRSSSSATATTWRSATASWPSAPRSG